MQFNIAKIDIGQILRSRLAAPSVRELAGGILLYGAMGLMVFDTLSAWWLGRDMPTWHWAVYAPVVFLAAWLLEKNLNVKRRGP